MSVCLIALQLNSRVELGVGLVVAVGRGAGGAVGAHARRVVPAVLAALRSPLAAARAAELHCKLGRVLLPRHTALADTLARVTVR